jgi:FKBP-type peptidyl-prolyl cis-trans isomerase
MEAIQDVLDGQPKMTDTEARQVIALDQQQKLHERIDKNVKEGEAFLAQNKTNAGVKVRSLPLPDGQTAELQYTVITEGTGAAPQAHDIVTVNYRGTLINGKEFDNSAKRGGQPFKCNVSGVIRGMSEALQSMKVGSKWKLYMPASLAYGERGTSGVEPGSALIIELELLSDEPGPAPKPVTSDIIRVPSADEMKAGAKIEVIKADDLDKKSATGQTNQAKTGS